MGLAGLAFALFVGVMAFAFTTSPAGQPEESAARFLQPSSRTVELASLRVPRAALDRASMVTVVPVNEQALLASRDELSADDASIEGPAELADPPTSPGGDDAPSSDDDVVASRLQPADTAPAAVPAEVASSSVVAEPPLAPGDRVQATVSFYYCERGVQGLHPGDGGGFCGFMRDGSVVYPGAAACAYVYLGQQFRIIGDPLERVYRCADTGSAVHGLHRDIWFMSSDDGWSWQLDVGQTAIIEILP